MTHHIKTFLSPYLQSKMADWKIALLKEWPRIVGRLAHHTTIIKVYNDTIILGVYDSCWLQELYTLAPMLIKTINQSLDQPRIKQIRLKQVERRTTEKNDTKQKEETPAELPIALTQHEKMALNRVKNEKLRATLESFLLRCYRERKR